MTLDLLLEILGFCVGILYLWWEYHASPRVWLASVVMPAISMWIYFDKGLYADFGINIYYLVIAVYGYWHWTHRSDTSSSASKKDTLPITHIHGVWLWGAAAVAVALWAALWAFLHFCTDSTVPVADAFTTALSIVATWMLARKYIEQWLVWMAVDTVCVGLYIYKGIYLYATLYLGYTLIAQLGYRKWQKSAFFLGHAAEK